MFKVRYLAQCTTKAKFERLLHDQCSNVDLANDFKELGFDYTLSTWKSGHGAMVVVRA